MPDKISKAPCVVSDNLGAIHNKISVATRTYQTQTGVARPVTLVAVSKRQPDDRINDALATGQRVFGENRVQEAYSRWAHRRELYRDLKLHLIGPLQTNKISDAVTLFDVIEVVDRPKLATALGVEMTRQNRQLECYIQVNTGEEEQKSGIAPEEADAFIHTTADHFERSLAGDMVSPVRTSQQAWCQTEPCLSNPLVNRVHERVVNVTGIPAMNAEFFQVLL